MGDALTVMIPNGSRTGYHARASLSELKALLTPQLRLTRAGNISTHQPAPPPPQPYDFYLAQLVHYGLDFHFDSESAQRDLEIQISLGRLQVPPSLLELEKELKRAHDWKQNQAYKKAVRNASQQLRSHSVDTAVAVGKSKQKPEHEATQSPATPKAAKQSLEKNKAKMDRSDDETSSSGPDDETSSSGPDGDSGDESDTIAVAHDALQDTSSESSTSSSSEGFPSALSGSSNMNNQSSKKTDKKSRRDDDPFVDRQDSKRVKLDKADEQHNSLLESSREGVPSVVRKQAPPSQVKIRRIASQPLITGQPINSAINQKPDTQAVNTSFAASTSKVLSHQPSVNPHQRPSWNLPVRSPSSAQKDTPKSVTFSQVQRETPTRVPLAEKATFSSAMKTPQRSQHRRTPSESSDHSHMTPLRSILKNAATPPHHQTTGNSREPEINMQHPPYANTSASRSRKRKRRSRVDSSLGMYLDGARDQPDTPDDPYKGKPHIVSDIVNGIPLSSLQNGSGPKLLHTPPHHENSRAVDNNGSGWVAANAATYQPQQQQQQQEKKKVALKQDAVGRPSPLSEMHLAGMLLDESILVQAKTARNGLGGGVRDLGRDGNGNRKRGSLVGHGRPGHSIGVGLRGTSSGSRGGLVRAGGVY